MVVVDEIAPYRNTTIPYILRTLLPLVRAGWNGKDTKPGSE